MRHNIPRIIDHVSLFRVLVDRCDDPVDIITASCLLKALLKRQFLPLRIQKHDLILIKKLKAAALPASGFSIDQYW